MVKFIPGYEKLYSITDQGFVYSLYSRKYLKGWKDVHGYYRVSLRKNKTSKDFSIHRLVLLTFKGIENKRIYCNHLNIGRDV